MIKYEIKKNIIYNKGWILILLVMLQLFFVHAFDYNNKMFDEQNYLYYYEYLQGKITTNKLDFIDNEEKYITGFEEKKELLENQYKNNTINDKQYIENLDILNSYHYRASVFEDIKEYVEYIKADTNRDFINERHMNSYLNMSIPYGLIAVIILNIIISFQNEESMYLLTKTTVEGNSKLIGIKIVTLVGINSLIFILYFLIDFVLKFRFNYFFELFVQADSIRMLEGTFFHGNIITMILVIFLMEWFSVIFLSCLTSLLYLRIRISGLKLCILEIGVYVISFLLFDNTKWLYFILPIGFFNPLRYFTCVNVLDVGTKIQHFNVGDLIIIIAISVVFLMLIFLKRKRLMKIPTILILVILITGCHMEKEQVNKIEYNNINGFNYNENIAVFTVDNKMIDLQLNKSYQINRDPLKEIETITSGYMYHQFFYYTEIGENEWSLQRLNTETFEQVEIYRSSLYKYDILGNIISSSRYNRPQQIYINNEYDIYIIFDNRVEVLSSYNNTRLLFEQKAFILKIEQDNIYYINDKSQLEVFNTKTGNHKIYLDLLISNAYIDEHYIYYTRLKDESLWRIERDSDDNVQLIQEEVNFFQVIDNEIYYTLTDKPGINVYSLNNKINKLLLNEYSIYAFSTIDDKIVFTAYDKILQKVCSYYLKDNKINNIEVSY